MPARHEGRDILTESIRGVDVKRRAAGELNRVFDFKLMELLEERLPDIGDGGSFEFRMGDVAPSKRLRASARF